MKKKNNNRNENNRETESKNNYDFELRPEDIGLLQLSDSFFPTGMYTMSNGLEALFYSKEKKLIANPDVLLNLLKVYIENQIGPADCTALGAAYEQIIKNNIPKLIEVDNIIFSMKLIEEIRNASSRSGTQLLRCVGSFITDDKLLNEYLKAVSSKKATGVFPVAMAVSAHSLGIPRNKAALIMLYGFTVSMVGAALRMGMLQHFDGQMIIHRLRDVLVTTIRSNINRPLTGIWQFAPGIDLIQISHEIMPSKMFIT
ncbi:MAG TPA: urease accessory UreF family protein [Nitrososphaeraceae archaeon]|nr:urease accessory UreF family protein [Nitrososphaeraceae archaeon]